MTAPDDVDATFMDDTETNLLCALMWSDEKHPTTRTTINYLTADDFHSPMHGQLFQIIQENCQAGEPFSVAAINATLDAGADQIQGNVAALRPLLVEVMTANVVIPEQAEIYGDMIIGASYRRQFAAMATTLAGAAEHAPEDQLFSIMVEHGKHQRDAQNRREGYRPAVAQAKQQSETLGRRAELFRQHNKNSMTTESTARAPATDLTAMLNMTTTTVSFAPAQSPLQVHAVSGQELQYRQQESHEAEL